tara:strand:- start:2655 stop:2942 length:288 start_codon:yes stop_codon:yes gene_type:complete
MSVMGPDGKIQQPGGGSWSPYGDTDEEIQENMKTGRMPNAPDAFRVRPKVSGIDPGSDFFQDLLGDIGALAGTADQEYNRRKKLRKKRAGRRKKR